MKLIATSIAALALTKTALAESSVSNTHDEIEGEPEERKLSSIVEMLWHKLDQTPSGNIQVQTVSEGVVEISKKLFGKYIQNYGCHCFPGDTRKVGGQGLPRDALDSACRDLHRCHKCVNIEFPDQCDTAGGGYKYQRNDDATVTCMEKNIKPDCQTPQCLCDDAFSDAVKSFWNYNDADGAWKYDHDLWLNRKYVGQTTKIGGSVFDYEASCELTFGVAADACCGDAYPNKIPYNTGSGKECCASAAMTYNTAFQVCCKDDISTVANGCPDP